MIKLSPSALNLYLECPKCFWLERARGIHRPNGPFPSLPSGIDSVLKKYFDQFRGRGELPPEIKGKVEGKLLDNPILQIWRQNLKGIRFYDEKLDAELMGALDDCLIDGDAYIPVDYKTRGWLAKDDSHTYYQNQLNVYTLLLEKNGYKHKDFAYLIFYSPKEVLEEGRILFNVEVRKVEVNPKVAYKVFEQAVELLRGPQPSAHSACQFCSWGNDFLNFE
ncbi:MAG TPA: PD-(D/E)XK nuclease family protein [Candidatus Paceibacterota bacterium]